MNEHHLQRARQILKQIHFGCVATASVVGTPWNSPVGIDIAEDGTMYWLSDTTAQHSQNILENAEVFIVFYDSTVQEGDDADGVYIQAKAYQLDELEDVRKVPAIVNHVVHSGPEKYVGDSTRRFYKAIPQKAWLNDAEMNGDKFVRDCRVELDIAELLRS